jgi:integrase
MPRPRNSVPSIRPHSSGQARVTIEGKDYLLGKFGSPEAEEAYRRILAQWLAREGPFAPADEPITITEVIAGYWLYAEKYYGYDRDPKRGDCWNLKSTLGILRDLYGSTKAADFGPLDLRAVQGEMVRRGRKLVRQHGQLVHRGWSRKLVNQQVSRIKQIFRWAVTEELVPPAVWQGLLAVPGLRKGKTDARETDPVGPVPLADVEAAKKHLRSGPAAMIDFVLTTGCRPNEACQLRAANIDKTSPACWVFRPGRSKTEHHGHARLVLIGPRAQAVLAPFLDGCGPDEWVFSPRREEEKRHAEKRARRRTKPTPSAILRAARSQALARKRPPKDRYTTASLRRALDRACRKAGVPVFGPNRLRHTRATELRPHGLDVVGTILGHSKLETTQVYSEKNLAAAMALVARVG